MALGLVFLGILFDFLIKRKRSRRRRKEKEPTKNILCYPICKALRSSAQCSSQHHIQGTPGATETVGYICLYLRGVKLFRQGALP